MQSEPSYIVTFAVKLYTPSYSLFSQMLIMCILYPKVSAIIKLVFFHSELTSQKFLKYTAINLTLIPLRPKLTLTPLAIAQWIL